jgi:hypothetical protein
LTVTRSSKNLNLVPFEHVDHPFPRCLVQRVCDPKGSAQHGQNFRNLVRQNFRKSRRQNFQVPVSLFNSQTRSVASIMVYPDAARLGGGMPYRRRPRRWCVCRVRLQDEPALSGTITFGGAARVTPRVRNGQARRTTDASATSRHVAQDGARCRIQVCNPP